MLKSESSFASLLVKQSPSMHYGHGWLVGESGKRWHPCNSQKDLLAHLTDRPESNLWERRKGVAAFITNLHIETRNIRFMKMTWLFVTRHYQEMVATFLRLKMVLHSGAK